MIWIYVLIIVVIGFAAWMGWFAGYASGVADTRREAASWKAWRNR